MGACPSCSRDLAPGFAFCPHCGAGLATADAIEERKLVTVLFADVTGSTRLAEDLDAEEVRELMAAYFSLAREEIEARGGTVEKFIGDAVMAVFGVPVAHEDDPSRAMRAALAVRARLAALNERHQSEGRRALEIRIGINTGEVIATTTPRAGEGMVTGDAVNVAARLQQQAGPGQIVVGRRAAAAAPAFSYRSLGSQTVRGKAEQVDVRELVGEEAGTPDPHSTVLRAPLVGRDGELALLTSLYDRVASDGQPHLVTLYGQAGVGKSRLTADFLAGLARRTPAPRVVRGRCLPYGSGVTFWALAEILKSEAGILDSDAPADAVTKLEQLGERLIGRDLAADPRRTTALLAFTVGIAIPGFDVERIDRDQLRSDIHAAWRVYFSALAATAPVVAVIEDIHWADAPLLDLLEELSERTEGPVLVLCPARPELLNRRPGWGGGRRRFTGINIDPLTPQDTGRLVRLLLTIENLPISLHERIVERAGGNPFFIEEILRHQIDEGRVTRSPDGWRATDSDLATIAIPDTVQAVLAARIDLLGPEAKRVLQAAAVVGRIFWPEPIAQFTEADAGRVKELLGELESRDFVLSRIASSMAGQPEFIFKHALVRDVAYESIPKRERAAAHLRVADWIEAVVGDRRLEVIEFLAHHYTEAERAASWARVAPDRHEEIRARAVALLYEAATEATRHVARERARERIDVGLTLARGPLEQARGLEIKTPILLWGAEADEAWRCARKAVDLRIETSPTDRDDRRAVARVCGVLLAIPTRWPGLMRELPTRDEAERYARIGLDMLEPGDSEERVMLLMARGAWGWGFASADDDPQRTDAYMEAAREAVAMARRLGRPDLISAALDVAGAAVSVTGGYGAAHPYQEERLALVPALEDMMEVTDIHGTNAWQLTHIGEYRRAAEQGAAGIVTSRGLTVWNTTPYAFQAVAQFRLGDWDGFWSTLGTIEAIEGPERVLRYHLTRIYSVAGYLKEVAGDSLEADRYFARLDRSQASLGPVGISGARPWIVMALARRGAFAEARERLAVVDPVRDSQNRDFTLEAWADLIAAEGAFAEAPAVIHQAREWAESTGLRALPAFADRLEGTAAIAAGDLEAGIDHLTRARETFSRLEAAWERARTEIVLADALMASDRMPEATAVASGALETVSGLAAPREIERATELARGIPATAREPT